MEWLFALALFWGDVEHASTQYYAVEMERQAIVQAEEERLARIAEHEAALFPDPDKAEQALSAQWIVFPREAYQGDALMVRADREQTVEWNGVQYELLPFQTGYYAVLPIPANMKPGEYEIGGAAVTILQKSFSTQYLEVTEQQEAMRRNTERIAADQQLVNEARSRSEPSFLFEGPFIKPVEGRLSTPYGFTRYINGNYSGRHMAIDLAAPEGTPIKATAAGVVALSQELYLTGNSIYIDHGMGLFSQYAHLSELQVEVGDYVEAGQVIGLVGSTGFSTGPHLHFTFWLHNVQAIPDLFFDSTPFHW